MLYFILKPCIQNFYHVVLLKFQFNLFGGTVLKLGTDRHHKQLLEGIDNLQDVGCFGLTELGYGNNAVEMETTAIYDDATKEFIVNTPHPLAQKYWITNGAIHAKHIGNFLVYCYLLTSRFSFAIYLVIFLITNIFSIAVVFARLIVNGKNEGLHGVLVRIRDNNMKVMPGVTVEDMGHKMGLNGVDNAKLSFDQVNLYIEGYLLI